MFTICICHIRHTQNMYNNKYLKDTYRSVKKTACVFFLYDVHCTLIIHIVYISKLCKICVFKDVLKMKLSSPIVSGNCCSMLEESRRSSRDSHPEMSASRLSILFLARSR